MKKYSIYIYTAFLLPILLNAQLTVNNTLTPQQLVQTILTGANSDVIVSNVIYTGAPNALGRFNGANSNIGLSSGIVMSTGSIFNAAGANNDEASSTEFGRPGYNLLNPLARGATNDACILEFDFEAKHPLVEFTFVFGSEEYLEYVNTEYNDVFGFFVSGPGISGQRNIALVPETNTPITINTINDIANGTYFVNNNGGATVEYDGFTKPLTARIQVTPCVKYHIILAIADVADDKLDSGVFLEANSFASPSIKINRQVDTGVNDSTMYEGCSDSKFILTRTGSIYLSYPVNLQFTGTAINGTDYQSIQLSTSFPSGTNTLEIPINSIFDGIEEPIESITLVYTEISCPDNIIKQKTIYIQDPPPINVTVSRDTTVLCPNLLIPATALATGGIENTHTYTWSPIGLTGNIVNLPTIKTQTYTVTATDKCKAQFATADIRISLNYISININASNDQKICKNDSVYIWGKATGGRGGLITSWSDNLGLKDSVWVRPPQTYTYYYTAKDSCNVILQEPIVINVEEIKADFTTTYIDNNVISFTNQSSSNAVSYSWKFGNGDSTMVRDPTETFKDTGLVENCLIVTSVIGCKDTNCKDIRIYPPYKFWLPNTFTPNSDLLNDNFKGYGEGYTQTNMDIYNRWGEQVFSTNQMDKFWDGSYKNKDLPIGVYYYKVVNTTPANKIKYHQGNINLIR